MGFREDSERPAVELCHVPTMSLKDAIYLMNGLTPDYDFQEFAAVLKQFSPKVRRQCENFSDISQCTEEMGKVLVNLHPTLYLEAPSWNCKQYNSIQDYDRDLDGWLEKTGEKKFGNSVEIKINRQVSI